MTIAGYKVGLVVGQSGLNPAQMENLAAQIKMIDGLLEDRCVIQMQVAALDLKRPAETLPAQIKALIYKGRVHHQILPAMPAGGRVPVFLYHQLKDNDEIWCCPGDGQTNHGKARAAALYQYAQLQAAEAGNNSWLRHPGYAQECRATALRFKLIVPWVEPALSAAELAVGFQPGLVTKQRGKW